MFNKTIFIIDSPRPITKIRSAQKKVASTKPYKLKFNLDLFIGILKLV